MRKLSLLALIPLIQFDQSKLEQLMRKIPEAYVKSVSHTGFVRKHYAFPKQKSTFQISCEGDHYAGSQIPTMKKCELSVTGERLGDEYLVEFKSQELANALHMGKLFASERVYGQAYGGEYRQLFRYQFSCTGDACKGTFAVKPKE